jgi:hypothetical protein
MAGADGDIGAFTGQRLGNGTSDAARAAQDDGVLSFEMQIHFGFLLLITGECGRKSRRNQHLSSRRGLPARRSVG